MTNIENCLFKQNKGSAIFFYFTSAHATITDTIIANNENGILVNSPKSTNITIIMTDTLFEENSGVSLGVHTLNPSSNSHVTDIILYKVRFINNTNPFPDGGIVQVDETVSLSIRDSCLFKSNEGSSIQALATMVNLSETVIFEDNVAFQGGAISLRYSTLVLLINNTNILFINNKARRAGGSIYVDQSTISDPYSGSGCFYSVQGLSFEQPQNTTLTFINNTAFNGGHNIYGTTPNSKCKIETNDNNIQPADSCDIQRNIFNTFPSHSSVTSDPRRVCLCDHNLQLQCANLSYIFHNTERYPGEEFFISLAVVGFGFGTVTGSVYANLLPQANQNVSSLEKNQKVRLIGHNGCSQLDFTVNSLNKEEIVVLTANNTVISKQLNYNSISSYVNKYSTDTCHVVPFPLLTVPIYINVTLLDCPPGFCLDNITGKCECSEAVRNIGINNCSTYNITRSGTQWISPTFDPSGILLSKYCPLNYCQSQPVTLDMRIDDSDKQCALNHIGLLCGGCPDNFSMAIGSSRCMDCPDSYHTLLLMAFAAAGILLVFCIKILDITVSTGTVNGLLLYANIIWSNQSILFPPHNQTSPLLRFLKTFIAWLNLDFGIETCFIQHLNGYWKTWLQFVFPAYICLILSLIILVSNYSTRATKIFGNNSVPVLATLFLLAYAKLLRTILTALEFTVLEFPDGQRVLWSFDGNVSYFSLEHSVLFVVAVLILLVLWLPYTLVLFFIQPLRRYSHYRPLKWVARLAPLFDAYLGPLKQKHQYWIGLGLLARLVLQIVSAITLTILPFVAALAITLCASLLCFIVPSVYRQWRLSVLEGCFFFNLAMFSTGSLLIKAQGGSKDKFACISLGITFLLFLAIVGYHVVRACLSLRRQLANANQGYEDMNTRIQIQPQYLTTQDVSFDRVETPNYREPLLDSTR